MTSLQNESQRSEYRSASENPEEQKHQQKGRKNLHQVKSCKVLKVTVSPLKGPEVMKGHKCSECGESFKEKSALLKHLKSHAEGRPYQCMTCGKSFSKKSSLVTHQQTHTERKLFTCDECGRTFAQKSRLLAHNKTHLQKKDDHRKSTSWVLKPNGPDKTPKERPYKCPECKKMFVFHKNFIKHQKSHVRVMPLSPERAHHVREQLNQVEKIAMALSSEGEKPGVDRSELMLEELTKMRENIDALLLSQQFQLQVLQQIQKQLGFLVPGNDLINSNVYSLGLLLSQQSLARGLPLPRLFNPINLLPESARPFSSRIPT